MPAPLPPCHQCEELGGQAGLGPIMSPPAMWPSAHAFKVPELIACHGKTRLSTLRVVTEQAGGCQLPTMWQQVRKRHATRGSYPMLSQDEHHINTRGYLLDWSAESQSPDDVQGLPGS